MPDLESAKPVPHGPEDTASEARVRATFAAAKVPVLLIGLDGRYVQGNQAFFDLVGFDEPTLQAMEPLALLHPEDRPGYVEQLRQLVEGPLEHFFAEPRVLRKDGSYFRIRAGFSLVRGAYGAATHVVAVGTSGTTAWSDGPQPEHASILLVDDDKFIRRYAAEMLTQLGYKVTSAGSGPEALAAIRSNEKFDLLFTDIVMPGGINGHELVVAARQLRPQLAVLYTSGFMSSEIVRLTRNDPSAQLLEKPYRRVELAEAVRAALATARPATA